MRVQAIQRSRGQQENAGQVRAIVLSQEFREIFANRIYPLGENFILRRAGQRLLASLEQTIPGQAARQQ